MKTLFSKIISVIICICISVSLFVPLSTNAITYRVAGIAIENFPSKLSYIMGEELDLSGGNIKVTIKDDNNNKTYEYKLLNDAGVSVTGYNKNISGDQQLTVSYSNITTKFTVYVQAKNNMTLRQTNITIYNGDTHTLEAVFDANAIDKSIVWTSSDEKVVTVNNTGMVTALSKGTAVITAKSNYTNFRGKPIESICTVTVIEKPVGTLLVHPTVATTANGGTASVTVLLKNDTSESKKWKAYSNDKWISLPNQKDGEIYNQVIEAGATTELTLSCNPDGMKVGNYSGTITFISGTIKETLLVYMYNLTDVNYIVDDAKNNSADPFIPNRRFYNFAVDGSVGNYPEWIKSKNKFGEINLSKEIIDEIISLCKRNSGQDLKAIIEQNISSDYPIFAETLLNYLAQNQFNEIENAVQNITLDKGVDSVQPTKLKEVIDDYCTGPNVIDGDINFNYVENPFGFWYTTFDADFELAHWIIVDLGQETQVSKFYLYGLENGQSPWAYFSDYSILGSNDKENWNEIIKIKSNTQLVTTHNIAPVKYRYFKMYITMPVQNNPDGTVPVAPPDKRTNIMRLVEFKIMGEVEKLDFLDEYDKPIEQPKEIVEPDNAYVTDLDNEALKNTKLSLTEIPYSSNPTSEFGLAAKLVRTQIPSKKLFSLYDMKLFKNNVEVQPNGSVKLTFIIPDAFIDFSGLDIVHFSNGKATLMNATIIGNRMIIVTDKFSNFGIVADPTNINPLTSDNGVIVPILLIVFSLLLFVFIASKRKIIE